MAFKKVDKLLQSSNFLAKDFTELNTLYEKSRGLSEEDNEAHI